MSNRHKHIANDCHEECGRNSTRSVNKSGLSKGLVRAKKLQRRFKDVLSLAVSISTCRQLVKEQGAKKTDALLKGDDDGTYEDLKALSEKY